MANVSRDGNSKEARKMLEIKNAVTQTKNACDGLLSRQVMAQQSVSLRYINTNFPNWMQIFKNTEINRIEYPVTVV